MRATIKIVLTPLLFSLSALAFANNGVLLTDAQVQNCIVAVDDSNDAFAYNDTAKARQLLETALPACAGFPQLHHNLGVIESQHRNWDAAIEQFTLSITADYRAAESFNALQSIHRYRASLAYQQSLNTSVRTHLPMPTVQLSTMQNSDAKWQPKSNTYLRSVSTVEYELYDWWIANQEGEVAAKLAHYEHGFPIPLNSKLFNHEWDSLERDISFTEKDAVVVLSYSDDNASHLTQLLLRLHGNRWIIYRETHW